MKRVAVSAALVSIAIALVGTVAQTLSPTPVFEGNITTLAKNGAVHAVHVSVQLWGNSGGMPDEIPLRGFYVAHLLSGQLSATVDGQTMGHLPGDYWTVKTGGTMKVKVLGEVAVLETIVVAKQ
jgi:hypothetical protein